MKLGILFAGQGSQKVGMGKDLYENSPEFKEVFSKLPKALRQIAFEGPMEQLSDTRNTQSIMVAFAIGITEALRKAGIKGEMTAGLSLGEYSALHYAGVFDTDTALKLVNLRGNAMADAAIGVDCKMTAVLGLEREKLKKCIDEAKSLGSVSIANYNCPLQIVIAGEGVAVDKASELAKEAGAKRCMPLPVSGPFHTEFMKPAGKVMEKAFGEIEFKPMEIPVIFNCIGREKVGEEKISDLLVKQVSSSVYFEDSIKYMINKGIDTIIEIGPGKTLSGFVKKTDRQVKLMNIETYEDLEKVISEVKGEM